MEVDFSLDHPYGAGAHARTCLRDDHERVRDGSVASTVRDVGSRGADKGAIGMFLVPTKWG